MVKGFKDANDNFHPITQYKGVRKKSDKSIQTTGVKLNSIRKKRSDIKPKLPKRDTPEWNKLKDEVVKRMDSDFNEIQLENLKTINESWFEDVVTTEPNLTDLKDYFGELDKSDMEFEEAHDEDEIKEAKDELRRDQEEIMWGTVFEAKSQSLADKILENSDKIISDAGLTIVDMSRSDDEGRYATAVFLGVNGAGYDFYEQHWIPLYRILGWIQMGTGFKDKNKKFHPLTQTNGVRKSRVQSQKTEGVKIVRKARDNNAEILRNQLKTFNRQFPVKIEYGDAGGKLKGLKFEGTHSFIAGSMTRSEAITCLEFTETFIDALPTDRKARDMFDEDEEQEPIVAQFQKGDVVMISPDNDNDNYDEFRGKKLRIIHVATNRDEHNGFDESIGQALYDLETIHGKSVGFSLYDYELESA